MTPICIKHGTELAMLGMCSVCIEELAILSAQNMGTPNHYFCGYCGSKCNQEEIMAHTTTKKCYIGLVGE